jgi:hypothetical protein
MVKNSYAFILMRPRFFLLFGKIFAIFETYWAFLKTRTFGPGLVLGKLLII